MLNLSLSYLLKLLVVAVAAKLVLGDKLDNTQLMYIVVGSAAGFLLLGCMMGLTKRVDQFEVNPADVDEIPECRGGNNYNPVTHSCGSMPAVINGYPVGTGIPFEPSDDLDWGVHGSDMLVGGAGSDMISGSSGMYEGADQAFADMQDNIAVSQQ